MPAVCASSMAPVIVNSVGPDTTPISVHHQENWTGVERWFKELKHRTDQFATHFRHAATDPTEI